MASQASSGSSRLAQMQMRFQQRQQQEKEQRRIELSGSAESSNETDVARSSLTTAKASNIGNGKVRQMFDERRRGAGIDRSNPLKPIKPITTSSKALSTPTLTTPQQNKLTHKVTGVRSQDQITVKATAARKPLTGGSMSKQSTANSISSRSSYRADKANEQNNNSTFTHKDVDSLDGYGDSIINDNNNNNKNSSNGHSHKSPNIKLNPVLTKKSPLLRTAASRQGSTSVAATATKTNTQHHNGTAHSLKTESISTPRSNKSAAKSPMATARTPDASSKGPPPPGMVTCRICGRHFNDDRIAKHEQVCEKMANSKRKIFDASKHRVMGTEAESYNRKKPNNARAVAVGAAASRSTPSYTSAAAVSGQKIQTKKNNWRQKHEEFIAAIRAAKQVQAHLARGGKLSDLPPPPPSENPDYVQCPHCGRRFNETAAERHIPKCATMLHNKPKPGAANNNANKRR